MKMNSGPRVMTSAQAMWQWLSTKFPGKVITESYLCLKVTLGNSNSVTWNVLQDTGQNLPGERRLERSDAFWATHHRFSIAKIPSGETAASMNEDLFVNPYVYTGTTEEPALRTLYQGYLQIQIAQTIYYNYFDFYRFKRVGTAQKNLAASANATDNLYGDDMLDDTQGFLPMTPRVLFSGQSTPVVEGKLPVSVNMTGETDTTNIAVMRYHGFYIADGAGLGKGFTDNYGQG